MHTSLLPHIPRINQVSSNPSLAKYQSPPPLILKNPPTSLHLTYLDQASKIACICYYSSNIFVLCVIQHFVITKHRTTTYKFSLLITLIVTHYKYCERWDSTVHGTFFVWICIMRGWRWLSGSKYVALLSHYMICICYCCVWHIFSLVL